MLSYIQALEVFAALFMLFLACAWIITLALGFNLRSNIKEYRTLKTKVDTLRRAYYEIGNSDPTEAEDEQYIRLSEQLRNVRKSISEDLGYACTRLYATFLIIATVLVVVVLFIL